MSEAVSKYETKDGYENFFNKNFGLGGKIRKILSGLNIPPKELEITDTDLATDTTDKSMQELVNSAYERNKLLAKIRRRFIWPAIFISGLLVGKSFLKEKSASADFSHTTDITKLLSNNQNTRAASILDSLFEHQQLPKGGQLKRVFEKFQSYGPELEKTIKPLTGNNFVSISNIHKYVFADSLPKGVYGKENDPKKIRGEYIPYWQGNSYLHYILLNRQGLAGDKQDVSDQEVMRIFTHEYIHANSLVPTLEENGAARYGKLAKIYEGGTEYIAAKTVAELEGANAETGGSYNSGEPLLAFLLSNTIGEDKFIKNFYQGNWSEVEKDFLKKFPQAKLPHFLNYHQTQANLFEHLFEIPGNSEIPYDDEIETAQSLLLLFDLFQREGLPLREYLQQASDLQIMHEWSWVEENGSITGFVKPDIIVAGDQNRLSTRGYKLIFFLDEQQERYARLVQFLPGREVYLPKQLDFDNKNHFIDLIRQFEISKRENNTQRMAGQTMYELCFLPEDLQKQIAANPISSATMKSITKYRAEQISNQTPAIKF